MIYSQGTRGAGAGTGAGVGCAEGTASPPTPRRAGTAGVCTGAAAVDPFCQACVRAGAGAAGCAGGTASVTVGAEGAAGAAAALTSVDGADGSADDDSSFFKVLFFNVTFPTLCLAFRPSTTAGFGGSAAGAAAG